MHTESMSLFLLYSRFHKIKKLVITLQKHLRGKNRSKSLKSKAISLKLRASNSRFFTLLFILYYVCVTYIKAGIQSIAVILHAKNKFQGETPVFTGMTQQIRRYFKVPTETKAKYHFFGATVASIALMIGLIVGGWQIYKAVFALTETTTTMPADVEFNRGVSGALASYLDDEGKIEVATNSVKLAKVSNWWNEDYKYRKQITLKNLSSASISTSSAQITVNTKELVDAGKLQVDCDDLRVAKLATSGATMAEQPRSLTLALGTTNCADSTATIIGFPLNETYATNATSSAYFLYYGNGSASSPSYPKEKYLSFDGTNDFVELPDYINDFSEFTVSVWFKTTVAGVAQYNPYGFSNNTIFQRYITSGADGGEFGLSVIGGKLNASFNLDKINDFRVIRSTNIVNDGVWHQATYIVKASNYFSLYLDGQLVGQTSITEDAAAINLGGKVINVGKMQYWGSPAYFNGNIDEVKIWNKALSGSEVNSTYINSSLSVGALSGYWSFDEITGQVVGDTSGNMHDGTLGVNSSVASDDPTRLVNSQAYSFNNKSATLVCPFNGSTTCTTGQTPTSATGAIRYATGSAIKFDGKNDSITLPSIPSITTPYTVSLWFNPSKTAQNGALLSLHGGNNYPKFVMTASGKLLAYAGNEKYRYGTKVFSASDLNRWWHTVFVIPNTTEVSSWKIYINGVDDSGVAGANNGTYYEPGNSGYIGYSNQAENFNGLIDEVAVFNGAYTSDQVTSLYNNGSGKVIEPESNLKLLYHFDENGDDPRNTGKAIDASGNGNHGTISGAKYVNDPSASSGQASPVKNGSYASHEGIFIEEGTTNFITNPSFENASATLNWGPSHFTYATGSATFTPSMAKRNSAGPFAAGPMIQSNINTSTAGDLLRASGVGATISGDFNSYFDFARGTIQFWITPEWNGNDGVRHMLLADYNGVRVEKTTSNTLSLQVIKKGVIHSIDVSSWTAGTTYLVSLRWDTVNPITPTNYACITINDTAPSCGDTDVADATLNGNVLAIGSYYEGSYSASAIIEGLTIYRRVLYDGLYGTDVGNGDEINLIYNGGTGKDPTLVTGSWDVVFALPTNASTGTLTTGTGNAWSMPHSSNLLGGTNGANGFLMNGNAIDDGFAFNGSSSLTTNLAAFWKLNESSGTRNDSVGINNLTDNNTVTQTTGKIGSGAQFTAANSEYLSINDNADLSTGDIDFTISAWVYLTDKTTSRIIAQKGPGWAGNLEYVLYYRSDVDRFRFHVGTGDYNTYGLVNANSGGSPQLNTWYHVVGWHDATNNTVNIQVNNGSIDSTSYSLGGYDSTGPFYIGLSSTSYMNGAIDSVGFWKRTLTADERALLYNSGSGNEYPFIAPIPTAQKIFAGGYAVAGGLNEGLYSDITVTAGQDLVVRGIAHSDGVSQPKLILYDQTNDVEIGSLTGTTTSTKNAPDVLLFTGEAPSGCTTVRVKLVNAVVTNSTVNWHQVEMYNNMISNSSFESGAVADPWIPTGWANLNLGSGDTEEENVVIHSGNRSLQYNTTASFEGMYAANYTAPMLGKFLSVGGWFYGDGSVSFSTTDASGRQNWQTGGNWSNTSIPVTARWNYTPSVTRVNAEGSASFFIRGSTGASGNRYVDDIHMIALDAVSLTATPATQANSTETNGIRVDGMDTLTQPIIGLSTTNGVIKFKFTPRHNGTVARSFGVAEPYLLFAEGSGSNRLYVRQTTDGACQTIASFNGTLVVGGWTCSTLNAGTTYLFEVSYAAGGNLITKIDGVQKGSVSGVVPFGSVLTTAYFGASSAALREPFDATITSFTTSSVTENSTSPYYKFGSKSIKIQAYDAPDQYVTTATASANAAYTLSAYIYDNTSTNVGGIVDATVATLASSSASLTTTYTDMGGGWWRLSHTTATIPAGTYNFGVEVKAGKTIYFDGVQLEQKAYSTTYTDGSLGNNYAWTGTANTSTSTRTAGLVNYSAAGNVNYLSGSASLWMKHLSINNDQTQSILVMGGTNSDNTNALSGTFDGTTQTLNFRNYSSGPSTSYPTNINKWDLITVVWDSTQNISQIYVNGVQKISSAYVPPTAFPSNATIRLGDDHYGWYFKKSLIYSDLRIFDQPLSATEITSLYNQGLMTHQSAAEASDRYAALGIYTSPVVDLGANGQWGGVPIAFSQALNGGTVAYSTRTSADNSIWSSWETVSGSTIASLPRRYLQWKADMTPSTGATIDSPVISGMTVKYVEDTTPPINPVSIALGYASSATASANLISGTWYNHATPKFAWDSADDAAANGQSASGIDSYYVFFTQDSTATPTANIADDCFRQTTELDRTITIGITPALCSLTDGTYYLRLQSKDNSGNISDPVTMFTYKYDGSIPNAPASVSTTSVGYTSNNAFTFFWPAATDNGPSGVSGYEYKTGTSSGAFADWVFTSGTTATDVSAYQEGQNFFLVRTVDTSGNVSGNTSNNVSMASFYYNASAPTQPRNVNITPETSVASSSASNVFTVAWDKPATYSGEIAKYYYCVNCTPALNAMTETTAAETVNRTLSNIALATQQGKNTLFIVAEDNNTDPQSGHGNRNFDAYSTTDFYASTIAPAAPTSLVVSDASDRDAVIWRLTLTWKAPATGGTPKIYQVYRAEGTEEYVKLGETTSTAYTDADLTQSTKYSYKVRAVDNAGSLSLFSAIVTRSPEGKYTAPPTNGGIPASSPGSTTALIKWSTSRTSFGTVEYGKTTTYGSAATETEATKDHVVKLTGLSPGVTYHYRVQSLDDSSMVDYNRVDAYSSDYSFTTLNTASVTAIEVTDVGLDSAVIAWKTTSLATSKVEYGPTLNYGKSIDISSSASESAHTTRLSGLSHSTVYHFRVSGTTSDGDDIFSQDNVFQTLIFPKVTALVMNTDQEAAGTTVVLAWSTNVPTTGEVMYQAAEIDKLQVQNLKLKVESDQLQKMTQAELATVPVIPKGAAQILYTGELETKHIQRVTGLTDGSIYIFTIRGRDEKGNQAISDPIRYVTGADTRPPTLQNIIIETPMTGVGVDAKAQIIISWDTDEPSTSQVLWGSGTGSEYPQATEKETALGTKHVVVLRDLQPTSSYHLKIISNDKTGNSTESKDTVVVTPSSQQAAFDIIIKNLEDVFGFLKL